MKQTIENKKEKKPRSIIQIVILLLLLTYSLIRVVPQALKSRTKIDKLQKEIDYLETKNQAELEKIKKYTENLERLDNDFERERIARNRLQMIKSKEYIYRLNERKQEEL